MTLVNSYVKNYDSIGIEKRLKNHFHGLDHGLFLRDFLLLHLFANDSVVLLVISFAPPFVISSYFVLYCFCNFFVHLLNFELYGTRRFPFGFGCVSQFSQNLKYISPITPTPSFGTTAFSDGFQISACRFPVELCDCLLVVEGVVVVVLNVAAVAVIIVRPKHKQSTYLLSN